jgi:murein DD-endopeptidase MepM/ murein hydrolase activator NlpD
MGATGNATGVHLHYEVIVNEMRVDPLTYGAQPPVG